MLQIAVKFSAFAAALAIAGCNSFGAAVPPTPRGPTSANVTADGIANRAGLQSHAIIGFSVDTPRRAATAAKQGINATILYNGAPAPGSALATALKAHRISVIDAAISGLMFYWECHRTHTVKPPPKSYGYNSYCKTDEDPKIDSERAVLNRVAALLARDAKLSYVVGFWVLDDWAWWDPGSGRTLLQEVHALIEKNNPTAPAICGFGAGLGKPGHVNWDPGTAANFSTGGCDVVGWYNYSPFGRHHPSLGKGLDWSMKTLLPAMEDSLEKYGWEVSKKPLYGIGQAWGGPYNGRYYQPGLTRTEMLDQSRAFCSFGAKYIGWYAWDDSGFDSRTQTPNNSKAVSEGIAAGISACRAIWK